MALTKKPVNGMRDVLPSEMKLREYLMGIIKETYTRYGFSNIETPIVEHIENLTSKQGGDNEKLIFKILKRGEKLRLDGDVTEGDLVDFGLRYDLTLPLARYFSNNNAALSSPFRAIQIGSVFRAERPQKGRYRQFTQCDIDILGEESILAEIELILATTDALKRVAPDNAFTVRINDRRILRGMMEFAKLDMGKADAILITLDKMDKIGMDGVVRELQEMGLCEDGIKSYMEFFQDMSTSSSLDSLANLERKIGTDRGEFSLALNDVTSIIKAVSASGKMDLQFDPTLVRGMGYYTGTIFEVSMDGFSGSVAGGGRYDKMIGKFTGKDTPACGFSIGFERIIGILMDQKFVPPTQLSKKAMLFEKGISSEKLGEILAKAGQERKQGNIVLVAKMNKNKKFQKEQLLLEGFSEFEEYYKEGLK